MGLGDEAVRKLPGFKAQEAANVAWACGRASVHHDSFFEGLDGWLCSKKTQQSGLVDYEPQHLAMVLWAGASLYPVVPEEDDEEPMIRDDDEGGEQNSEPAKVGQSLRVSDPVRGQAAAVGLVTSLLPECI